VYSTFKRTRSGIEHSFQKEDVVGEGYTFETKEDYEKWQVSDQGKISQYMILSRRFTV